MTKSPAPLARLHSDTRSLWNRAVALDREARAPDAAAAPSAAEETAHLPVPELLEVAREVGISPDSVLISVAETRLPDGGELRPRKGSPLWHMLLVETLDALEVSVHLPLEPDAALELLDRVLTRPEYRVELEDRLRFDPSRESVSVFRVGEAEGGFEKSSFHGGLELADGRVLIVAVVNEPGGGSRVRIRMPLYERGTNLFLSAGSAGLAGAGGVSAGTALGEAAVAVVLSGTTGLLPLAAVVIPAVLGAYVGAGAGIFGFRRLQKWGFGKGRTALHRLCRVLEMEAVEGTTRGQLPSG